MSTLAPALAGPAPLRRRRPPLALGLASCLVALLLLLPLAFLLLEARQVGWGQLSALLFRQLTASLLWNMARLAAVVTVAAAAIGTLAAFLVERTDLPGRRVLGPLLLLPLAVPDFVIAFGWISLAPAVRGYWGAVLVMTMGLYPLVSLPVAASLRGADPSQEETARTLGQGPWRTFWHVTLRRARPTILAGCLLVSLALLAEYGAFEILGYQTFTTEIFTEFQVSFNVPTACALSLVLVVLGGVVLGAEPVARGKGRADAQQVPDALLARGDALELHQAPPDLVHPGLLDDQGHQVGVREVAIVVGKLLAPHREGDLLVRVPEPGLLDETLPLLHRLDLAPDLVLQRLLDVLEGIHVLDFGLDPQLLLADRADRDVGVAAEAPLLHVPVADLQEYQDRPELPEVLCRLLRGADVRLGHDLHQGKAAPVVVYQTGFRLFQGARMHQLARVLLEMDAVDPDPLLHPVQREGDETALRQRQLVLGDLVGLG